MTDTKSATRSEAPTADMSSAGALPTGATHRPPKEWISLLAAYREPNDVRSAFELAVTLIPFLILWCLAVWALSLSVWLALLITVPAAAFLVRLFILQHDCGHGALFRHRAANDWIGRAIGVLTMTPYDVWQRAHGIHHATNGNLDKRGVGDIDTLTIREYLALPLRRKIAYRLYRNPLVMFILGPAFVFLIANRLPFGFMKDGWRPWVSTMGTNAAMVVIIAAMIWFAGIWSLVFVHLPILLLAGAMGIWLFYVQHQFEETVWADNRDWQFHDAALLGSSHYDLPLVLAWLTGNIGVHHVHHLYSRIPFYRLPQVLRDFPELADVKRLTLLESFSCLKLRLWDEGKQKLVSYREAFSSSHDSAKK